MRTEPIPGSARSRRAVSPGSDIWALVAASSIPADALAIPSPDVMISAFASAGQLLALFSVALGGALFRSPLGKRGTAKPRRGLFVTLLLVLLVSLGANLLQYTSQLDARNERLRATLVRPSFEQGKKVGDVNLKTLSMSDQLVHPGALSTDAFFALWSSGELARDYELLDIRNPEEVEMGKLAGATAVPMPDFRKSIEKYTASGKPLALVCESGNRSGELCSDLMALGHSCKFIIGGYEKWVAENLPVQNLARTTSEIRDIPWYPAKEVLLDTADVERLVAERKPVFVDVRYPGDFDTGHLPGAINMPLRSMPTDEMWEALKGLPEGPVIAPCYDKRGCFYGMVLGLRLHRLGREFLGRYTLPWEYYKKAVEKDYVLAWKESNQKTLFGMLCEPLAGLLELAHGWLGSLAAAIVAMVLSFRLLLLPFAVKAERDKVVLQSGKGELEALQSRFAGDPDLRAREIFHWYRRNRISPIFGFIGASAQIFCFLWLFGAVKRYSDGLGEPFLWESAAGAPDGTLFLPVAASLLFFAGMALQGGLRGPRPLIYLAVSGFLFVLMKPLSVTLGFYVVVNLIAFVIQDRSLASLLTGRGKAPGPKRAATESVDSFVRLREAEGRSDVGNKARRLGAMLNAGLPVPDGFVLPSRMAAGAPGEIPEEVLSRVRALMREIEAEVVAVRSSGVDEDGGERSFAGIFESVVNVQSESVAKAIATVYESLHSGRADVYANGAAKGGGILVQKMIKGEFAGIMFTEHPAHSGSLLVELTAGLCKPLVNGMATGSAYRFGRISNRLLEDEQPPIDLSPLVALGRRIEGLFGAPQDIEWAHKDGRFFLLQARDITSLARRSPSRVSQQAHIEKERHRLLEMCVGCGSDDEMFVQNEMCELLPSPTPVSLSVLEDLWGCGGSVDLAARTLGLPYEAHADSPPLFTTVFGSLYMNLPESRRRMSREAGTATVYRLAREDSSFARDFTERFVPAFRSEMRIRDALDFSRMDDGTLASFIVAWRRRFVTEVYFEAAKINLLADFYMKLASPFLKGAGGSGAALLAGLPDNAASRMRALLADVAGAEGAAARFVDEFGHRASFDYELSEPRFGENPDVLRELSGGPERPSAPEPAARGRQLSTVSLDRARRFQALKEDAKNEAMREMALLRRALLESASRLRLDRGVFFCTLEEIVAALNGGSRASPGEAAEARQAASAAYRGIALPTRVTVSDIEEAGLERREKRPAAGAGGVMRGTLVAGDSESSGRVRVVNRPEDLGQFEDGEILVARFTDPRWTPVFGRVGGVVTEVGGWLSHAAILAREYNVTTVVGVTGATRNLETGDLIVLRLDGTIELVRGDAAKEREGEPALGS